MKDNLEIVFFYEKFDRSARVEFSGINDNRVYSEPPLALISEIIGRKLYELSQHGVIAPLGIGKLVTVTDVRLYVIGVPNVPFKSYKELIVTVKKVAF